MRSPLARSLPVAALVVMFATACGSGSSSSSQSGASPGAPQPLKVVATTTQVGDFARNVGGDKVVVHQILKPNVDPHDYEPSPADIQAIAEADVVVKNGVGLEKWLDQVITSAGFNGTIVDASQGVAIRQGDGSEEESAGDPHIWHNPLNAKIMVANIEKAFAAQDAADASAYQANLAAYDAKIDALDADITKKIDSIPADSRKLVTNHDAFGYYIDRYKLTFVGSIIPSFDTSAELSGKQIADLVAKIRSTGVTAIFSESSLPPKTAEAIGREAGVKVEAGEDSLYGDTLGPEGSAGASYLQMEEHNTDTIVTALKGSST
ncbi:metal ABC transporter substrate-binding protein [Planotetraspora kaengkrachanensis]|uniref:Metal ABC transporter substrate-binding protein n=1 Tax=Planotetraspora kaengkrachanensis TaxID=575193 RepID=A0A8J3PX04_9ACTN|nr:metal ABC transporter substrate-binding protein [Planotetraspora kaengkrachanensis]GIG82639.1 metal ABC transporter substrate-binding protein [Planotetraspora kaengkrachanensis]